MQPSKFAFGPRNYRLMFLGLGLLAAGFITMTLDSAQYGEGFLGITLGPILLVAGFIVEFFAIMAKSEGVAPAGPAATPATPAAAATTAPQPTPEAPRPTYKRV